VDKKTFIGSYFNWVTAFVTFHHVTSGRSYQNLTYFCVAYNTVSNSQGHMYAHCTGVTLYLKVGWF